MSACLILTPRVRHIEICIMRRFSVLLAVIAGVMAITSCGSYRRMAYLQDLRTDETYVVQERPETKISVGDKLSITVTCSTPALAAPFNPSSGRADYDSGSDQIVYTSSSEAARGYLVDKNGDIDFPVLGKINVAGTTLVQLKEEIERRLKEKPYITDPLVYVEFVNFQVIMLGQISNGIYNFQDGNATLLEAMAKAGGPSQQGVNKEIWVIRTVGGQRKLYTVNLRSKDLYDSPVYYLQQNDLIYVKPKNNFVDADLSNIRSSITFGLSILSTLSTIWLLARNLGN